MLSLIVVRASRQRDAAETPAPQSLAILISKPDIVLARIIHEIGGDDWNLFREETLWLFSPKHRAIVTRSVSEETLGNSSLMRRVTNNPG